MRAYLTPALALSGVVMAQGEPPASLVDPKELQDSIQLENLLRHAQAFETFAYTQPEGQPAGNRLVGGVPHNLTLDYISTALENTGYYDLERQPFSIQVALRLKASLIDEGISMHIHPMLYTPPLEETNAPVVHVNRRGCDAADYPATVAGNIALVWRGHCYYYEKSILAGAAGAIALIVYNNETGGPDWGMISGRLEPDMEGLIPTAALSYKDGDRLRREGTRNLTLTIDTIHERMYSYNLLASTKTGDADNVLMMGAHTDSVQAGPGINDNGSGSSALLEAALQLARFGIRNKIRFAWWTAEEQGLRGSSAWVTKASAEVLAKIRLYLNFDMIASPNYILSMYDGDGSRFGKYGPPGSGEAEKLFQDWYAAQGQNWTEKAFDGRSDYGPFLQAGVPCGGVDTGAEGIKKLQEVEMFGGRGGHAYDPNYHRGGDNMTNLSHEAFALNGKAVAFALGSYAASFDDFPAREAGWAGQGESWRAASVEIAGGTAGAGAAVGDKVAYGCDGQEGRYIAI